MRLTHRIWTLSLAIIAMAGSGKAWGEACPSFDYTLTTQLEVNQFYARDCDSISGNLIISGGTDITELGGLRNITSVGGDLKIGGHGVLNNLEGLANITSVGGDLQISTNLSLTSLDGLTNITRVGGLLGIFNNDVLTSLNGLDKITSVGGINIQGNPLTNLGALANITSVGGLLGIFSSDALTSLDGLDNITSVGGNLNIERNGALTNLDGLANITSVGGALDVANNFLLTNCQGIARVLGWPEGPDNVEGAVTVGPNGVGCNTVQQVIASVSGPSKPSITNSAVVDGEFVVEFTTSTTTDTAFPITGYEAACIGPEKVAVVGPSSPLTVSGLTRASTYSCTVAPITGLGVLPQSDPVVANIPADPAAAPTNLAATSGDSQAEIGFTAPADDGGASITNYEYSLDSGAWVAFNPADTISPVVIGGLANGVTVGVRLRAVNSVGPGAASEEVQVTPVSSTPPVTVPDAPTNLAATSGDSQAEIGFTAPADDGGASITNYEYSLDSGAWVAFNPADTISPVVIGGLANGVTVGVRLRAVNSVGPGAASEEVQVTPALIDGMCGSADGLTTDFQPSGSELCASGDASEVATTASGWDWSCSGNNGGQNASCSASFSTGSDSITVGGDGWMVDRENSEGFLDINDFAPDLPVGNKFPFGFLQYRLVGGEFGSRANVVIRYSAKIPPNAIFWKYGSTKELPEPHWYELPFVLTAANEIQVTLTDGGLGDNDLAVNGVIVDPSGIGVPDITPNPPRRVPTLPIWALAILTIIFGIVASRQLTRVVRSPATQ